MKRRNILFIVGKSGSGKTLSSKLIQGFPKWITITSYTSRPKRIDEFDDIDHHFTEYTEEHRKDTAAYTLYGGHHYWTRWRQFNIPRNLVYVIDEKGLIDFMPKITQTRNAYVLKLTRDNLGDVSEERKIRDKERIELPNEYFDFIVQNNSDKDALQQELWKVIKSIEERNG